MNLEFNLLIVAILLITLNDMLIEAVIQGVPVQIGDFPYVASLWHVINGHQCGGAIISERHVLTAGHCVHNVFEWDYVIKIGMVDVSDMSLKSYMIKEFHLHPDYVAETQTFDEGQLGQTCTKIIDVPTKNDLAIVETCNKFTTNLPWLSSLKQPDSLDKSPAKRQRLENNVAKIETAKTFPGQCIMCIFTGWGCSNGASYIAAFKELMYIPMVIHSNEDCAREKCWRRDDVFCAQHPSRQALCAEGATGSPLVSNGVLVGILSTVGSIGTSPSTFIDVSRYQNFITSILDQAKPKVNAEFQSR